MPYILLILFFLSSDIFDKVILITFKFNFMNLLFVLFFYFFIYISLANIILNYFIWRWPLKVKRGCRSPILWKIIRRLNTIWNDNPAQIMKPWIASEGR